MREEAHYPDDVGYTEDSGEAERYFQEEAERHSRMNLNRSHQLLECFGSFHQGLHD